jgi:dihydrolipoamide dehydrogenase
MPDARHAYLVVIGAGPAGYPAAFMAADLGMDVVLIDQRLNPGGVCLYQGCIPSKTYLHAAKLIHEAREASDWGIHFSAPEIDLERLRKWKDEVVAKLTGGLGQLSLQRRIRFLQARASFADSHTLRLQRNDGSEETLTFDHAIIATGSVPARPAALKSDSPRVMDSSAALELKDVPKNLLVVGGGYIGLELGTVYSALGSEVTVVEATSNLLAGADRDLVEFLRRGLGHIFHAIHSDTKVTEMKEEEGGLRVKLLGLHVPEEAPLFEKVLVAVGRRPNSQDLGLEKTRIEVLPQGFLRVDGQRRTTEPHIFAVGDVAGEPMLAHKATHEARIAVETLAGKLALFEAQAIPAVVFTDPEVAWCGLTETQALTEGREVRIARFPWTASGRATTLDRNDGMTKLILDPQNERVLGAGIVGVGAGELIAEGVLAVEMGANATDLKMTIHAHPTLSETVMEAAEVFFGHSPHLYPHKT